MKYALDANTLSFWIRGDVIVADKIKDSDVLIAAFCVINDCTLVTNNTKHFDNIDSLDVEDWSI